MDRNFAQSSQVRELMACVVRRFPEYGLPSTNVQMLIDDPMLLEETIRGMVMAVSAKKLKDGTMTKSDWQTLFGHLSVWDNDFNEQNYPLGDEDDEAEEWAFDGTGHEALEEVKRLGREFASLRACGNYIKANPDAQKKHVLVAIGARREIPRSGNEWFPVFCVGDVKPDVDLDNLGDRFDPRDDRFLLRKQKKA